MYSWILIFGKEGSFGYVTGFFGQELQHPLEDVSDCVVRGREGVECERRDDYEEAPSSNGCNLRLMRCVLRYRLTVCLTEIDSKVIVKSNR